MDDYNQFEMSSIDRSGNCSGGCLPIIIAWILIFGGIGFILSLFQ